MNETMIADRVAKSFLAGEDWELTDGIITLVSQVVREIHSRGGRCMGQASSGRIKAQKFVLDESHSIPIEIQLWEGSWSHDVIIIATFGTGHRLPLMSVKSFDAKAVVDAVKDAFMELVKFKR